MSLLGNIKKKGERKKAYNFYNQMHKLKGDPREIRKLRSVMSARLTAFIDTTFIEGAKKTELIQDSETPLETLELKSAKYKDVNTLSGIVCVYLPSKYTNYFFELGSLYQRAHLTANQALELTDETCLEIETWLSLDNPLHTLNFLRAAESEEGTTESDQPHQEKQEPAGDIETDAN